MVSVRKEKEIHMEGPGDNKRYQIDYILVRQRYRNGVKCCKSWPGADVFTDHILVATKMNIKLRKLKEGKESRNGT